MSEISKGVYSMLSQEGGSVVGLVGNRITPEARTQGAPLPSVVYAITADEPLPALSSDSGARKAQIEVMSLAATAAGASVLNEAVRSTMHFESGTFGEVVILHCLHSKSVSNYQPPSAGESVGIFVQASIFNILYSS